MTITNLFITQNCDTLHYAHIRNGTYRHDLWWFRQRDYVYLQHEAPTTLDVRAGRTVLWVKEVLPSGLLLLEGNDGRESCEHSKNCVPCHLSIEGTVHPKLVVVLEDLPCLVYGEKKRTTTMLLCDQCQCGWHITCKPPLISLPSGQWSCPRCQGFSIPGTSTRCTQWSCVTFIVLCIPNGKWWVIV